MEHPSSSSGAVSSSLPKTPQNSSFSAKSSILWNDPPLTGQLKPNLRKNHCFFISFHGLKCLVREQHYYVDGRKCVSEEFQSAVRFGQSVNFDAVLFHNRFLGEDFTHRTNIAWTGGRPSLLVVAADLGSPNLDILVPAGQTWIGKVVKLYLPDVAIVTTMKGALKSIVSLHPDGFASRKKRTSSDLKEVITDYVLMHQSVEFKVKKDTDCPLGLCAYDAKVLSAQEYRAIPHPGKLSKVEKLKLRQQRQEEKRQKKLAKFKKGFKM